MIPANAVRRRRLAPLLGALAMFGPFSIDTMFPAFPAIAAQLQASPLAMQQTLSVYMIAYALMSLLHGPVSDALGRRPVILVGVAAFVLASIGCALSTSIGELLVFRALQGMSAGAGLIVGRAIIRDCFEGAAAQRLMSTVSMIFGVAPAIAPIVGGWVVAFARWPMIFWLLALFAGLVWIASLAQLPETLPTERRMALSLRGMASTYVMILRDPAFVPLVLAGTFGFNALFVYISSAPAFVIGLLGLNAQQFAWLFIPAIGGLMFGSFLSGRLAGRVSAQSTAGLGYAVMHGILVTETGCALVGHSARPALDGHRHRIPDPHPAIARPLSATSRRRLVDAGLRQPGDKRNAGRRGFAADFRQRAEACCDRGRNQPCWIPALECLSRNRTALPGTVSASALSRTRRRLPGGSLRGIAAEDAAQQGKDFILGSDNIDLRFAREVGA